ncbi:MAG: biliverdin-producing heme oxygenase [bacterium]|nr:biliverdin-producing heme oxygenase [bacterium]
MQHSTDNAENSVSEQQGDSLSARLKTATIDLHHEVEHGSEVNRRIVTKIKSEGGDAGTLRAVYRDSYVAFLTAAYGFEHAVLTAVHEFGILADLAAQGYFAEHVDASALIQEDLEKLGYETAALAAPADFLKITCVAELAGVEYVRRGSRNGNAYIAHAVRGNLGRGAENGAAFLNLDSGQTRPNWERFRAWLDELSLDEHERQIAIDAALATFRAVGRWHEHISKNPPL